MDERAIPRLGVSGFGTPVVREQLARELRQLRTSEAIESLPEILPLIADLPDRGTGLIEWHRRLRSLYA